MEDLPSRLCHLYLPLCFSTYQMAHSAPAVCPQRGLDVRAGEGVFVCVCTRKRVLWVSLLSTDTEHWFLSHVERKQLSGQLLGTCVFVEEVADLPVGTGVGNTNCILPGRFSPLGNNTGDVMMAFAVCLHFWLGPLTMTQMYLCGWIECVDIHSKL